MTDKEFIIDLLRGLPDDVMLYDCVQKLKFVAAVRQGLAAFDENKDSISIEQVEPQLTSWSVTVGRKRKGRQKHNASKRSETKSVKASPRAKAQTHLEASKNEKQMTR